MTKIIILLSFFFTSLSLFAQDDYQYLSKGDWRLSGFGGYLLEFSTFSGELGVSNGGGGGLLVNHTFFMGGYGLGLSNDLVYTAPNDGIYQIDFGHGGFWLGYIFRSEKLIHIGVNSKFGWGSLSVHEQNQLLDKDNVFVITPQIEIEANVTRWFKANAGLGYRYTAGVTNPYVEKRILNSPHFSMSFLFGWFAKHEQKDESKEW